MFTLAFTFEDGIVGHLDFKTMEQLQRWLPHLTGPDVMKRHGVVSVVVSENRQKAVLAEAA